LFMTFRTIDVMRQFRELAQETVRDFDRQLFWHRRSLSAATSCFCVRVSLHIFLIGRRHIAQHFLSIGRPKGADFAIVTPRNRGRMRDFDSGGPESGEIPVREFQ
jgi:hypothetical protein